MKNIMANSVKNSYTTKKHRIMLLGKIKSGFKHDS